MSDSDKNRAQPVCWMALFPGLLFSMLVCGLVAVPLPWRLEWDWVPALDIAVAMHVDGLTAQFLLLITGVGTLVFVYAGGYLGGHPRAGRVYLLLLFFMLAMVGAVVSDNLIVLFVFWELTSVLSFMLIGFQHEQSSSRESAKQAILLTGFGGLCLLAGIILFGQLAGTYEIQKLLALAPVYLDDPMFRPALVLLFIGAFSKSAQFPFHFWLPNAMAAPTPVSAYLHSATMVKLGIYLLARFDAAFSDILFWEYSLVSVGTLTAVIAAIQTIYERDIKRILAWSTIATLGTLVMLVGLPGHGAALATSSLFFAHALYKAPLFFVAGNLDHGTGTRQIDFLRGMRRYMPWTSLAALCAAISMAGLPLTFGFVAKDAMTFAKKQAGVLHLVSYATVLVNAVAVAVAAIAAIHIFWGRQQVQHPERPHEAPLSMLLPPLVLVVLGLFFGFAPTLIDPLLGSATRAMAPDFDVALLEVSYDWLPVLEATLGVWAFGLILYLRWDWLHSHLIRIRHIEKIGPEAAYQAVLKLLPVVAAQLTRRIQHGRLPGYLQTFAVAVALVILGLMIYARPFSSWPDFGLPSLPVAGAAVLICIGAVAALFVRDHFVLLLVSGLVGYGSAVLFLFSGAPDVAFTQFAVETVFVVVVAAVLVRLRKSGRSAEPISSRAGLNPVKLGVALLFGGALTLLALASYDVPVDASLSNYYLANSLPEAKGRNVVNTILVDFRALDTFGEIAVLAFAFLAALPVFRILKGKSS